MQRIAAAPLGSFSVAEKLPENAFLTLPAAGQSAPTKLSVTPMPVQVFLRVLTYPTHKLSIGRLERSSETLYIAPKRSE